MRAGIITSFLLAVVTCVPASPARADVKPHALFSDHMVLQRDMKVPVWGTADAGETVTISFGGQKASAQAGPDGKWTAWLDPMKASDEPLTLTIAGANTIEIKDVLVGDVWLCSGQSNMELTPPKGLVDPEPEIAAANWPKIRMNLIEKVVAEKPLSDAKGTWAACTPEMMQRFSAAAYYFGREIHQKIGIHVGLIGAYYGGSNGQSWTRREAFETDPDLKDYLAQLPPLSTNAPAPMRPSSGGGPTSRYRPSNFYNGMIAPLIPFAVRGVIWYQGEANTANAKDAGLYAKLFSTMIQDWRAQWGQGDFPFIFVQLPTSEPQYPEPTDSAWARVRESQQKALAVKNTAMVVTIDIGEGAVVHARNKKEVGLRLGATALNKVYGHREVACDGPLFKNMEVKDDKALLSFDNAEGLVCKNPAGLKGFAVAGADGVFVWAEAKIDGAQVRVWSPQIKQPAAVRYAWADNPEISLFNRSGLPAAPFRTDSWPAVKITNPRASP